MIAGHPGDTLVIDAAGTGAEWATKVAVVFGTGHPAPAVGHVGDVYVDTATGQAWGPKTAGGWGAAPSGVLLSARTGVQLNPAGGAAQAIHGNLALITQSSATFTVRGTGSVAAVLDSPAQSAVVFQRNNVSEFELVGATQQGQRHFQLAAMDGAGQTRFTILDVAWDDGVIRALNNTAAAVAAATNPTTIATKGVVDALLAKIKAAAASATDFADFQTKVAQIT